MVGGIAIIMSRIAFLVARVTDDVVPVVMILVEMNVARVIVGMNMNENAGVQARRRRQGDADRRRKGKRQRYKPNQGSAAKSYIFRWGQHVRSHLACPPSAVNTPMQMKGKRRN